MTLKLKYSLLSSCLVLYGIGSGFTQTAEEFDFKRIEDNSFLIEEAYNQEPGVIQHISGFQYMKDKTWLCTFTDEWPVSGQEHQLSVTIPVLQCPLVLAHQKEKQEYLPIYPSNILCGNQKNKPEILFHG